MNITDMPLTESADFGCSTHAATDCIVCREICELCQTPADCFRGVAHCELSCDRNVVPQELNP